MPTYTCESIRDQWKSRAESLTAFVSQHLVNRTDAYGNYRSVDDRAAGTARTRKSALTSDVIQRHFMADDRGDLIGLHTTSPENTCRWLVVDIDHHGESDPDAECRNEDAAIAIRDKLENQGITSLLMRSNGRGGFHLWVIFNAPVDTATVLAAGHHFSHRSHVHVLEVRQGALGSEQAEIRVKEFLDEFRRKIVHRQSGNDHIVR